MSKRPQMVPRVVSSPLNLPLVTARFLKRPPEREGKADKHSKRRPAFSWRNAWFSLRPEPRSILRLMAAPSSDTHSVTQPTDASPIWMVPENTLPGCGSLAGCCSVPDPQPSNGTTSARIVRIRRSALNLALLNQRDSAGCRAGRSAAREGGYLWEVTPKGTGGSIDPIGLSHPRILRQGRASFLHSPPG